MSEGLFMEAAQAHVRGDLALAKQGYLQVLAAAPGHAGALTNLGLILAAEGDLAGAIRCHQASLARGPGSWSTHYNLGQAYQASRRWEEATESYRHALRLKPDAEIAWLGLGVALTLLGRAEEAVAAYTEGLRYPAADRVTQAAMRCNRAVVFREMGKLEEAEADFEIARQLAPQQTMPVSNLGELFFVTGRVDQALSLVSRACELEPRNVIAASAFLFFTQFHPGWDSQAQRRALDAWRARFADPLPRVMHRAGRPGEAERRLRVGYVSPDFRNHCQSMFMLPLLSQHEAGQCDVVCYSDCSRPDAVTAAIREKCHGWRETAGMSDEQLAELVRVDRIDVLVDLTMHMAGNRLGVFARKPAPVQVTWLAYPGSTGLTTIDYRLTDPHLDPPGCDESIYSEKTWRLPATFWCYDPGEAPEAGPLPARQNGFVTFGCLNNFCKVNEVSLALWAKVMARVPRSRLVLLADEGPHRGRTVAVLGSLGVAAERVGFVPRTERAEYMTYYQGIDVGLDTLPYNGHTTSMDSLYMGVPVVTLVGKTVVGRAGLSQLTNLGLTELIGQTPEAFVDIAVGLAGDLGQVEGLRRSLRERMKRSVLLDAGAFARAFEGAVRGMWRRHCGVS